ncbi:ABC transporter substrate-binding protein, partial [Streptomyces cavourensis]
MYQPSPIARRVAAATVTLVLAAGAAACGPEDSKGGDSGSGAEGTPQKGGTLTVLNRTPS